MWEPERVREASLAALAPYGIVPDPQPPLLGQDRVGAHRPLADVVQRCQALVGVLNALHGTPPDRVLAVLADHGLERWISEQERAYLQAGGDEDARIELTWRVEGLFALAWVLELAGELPLTGQVQLGADVIGPLDPLGGPPPATLRDKEVVAARLDLFACAHSAIHEHDHDHAGEWPEELVAGAIVERRHALEWFFAPGTDWDELSPET